LVVKQILAKSASQTFSDNRAITRWSSQNLTSSIQYGQMAQSMVSYSY